MPSVLGLTIPLLVLLGTLFLSSTSRDVINQLSGRVVVDKSRLTRWASHPFVNSGDCQVVHVADACEDVKMHHASSTSFLACGDPIERTHWYPAAQIRTVEKRKESSFREKLFKHDLVKDRTTELKIVGLEGDFVTHGLDVVDVPGNPDKVHIFAVNHARSGDSIVIFEHQLGHDEAVVVKNVKHPNIKTANGVAAVGPMEFFFTNDHYFVKGIARWIEEQGGPWTWASHVQYCDAANEHVYCHQVSAAVPGANGIAVSDDILYLGDSKNGTMTIFAISENKNLQTIKEIDLGAGADNVRILPGSKDPVVAIFPTIEDLPLYLRSVRSLGKEVLVPAGVLRLRKDDDYKPEMVYHNDGSVLSFMTAADFDPSLNVMVGAAVLQYGAFAVCKLPPGSIS